MSVLVFHILKYQYYRNYEITKLLILGFLKSVI